MGRPRRSNKHLPRRVYVRGGAYYYVDPTGTWHRLAKLGELPAMHRALADILAGDAAGTYAQLFDRFSAEVLPEKAPKTQREYRSQLVRLRAWCGHMPIGTLLPTMIAQYLDTRGATAPVAANREIALLSSVHAEAISRWRMIESNPCIGVKRRKEKARRHAIEDIDLMHAWTIAKPWMRALMAVAYITGQRQADCLQIRETDFDARGLNLTQGKTGTALALEWTRGLRDMRAYCLSVRTTTPIARWLICNRRGQCYTARSVRNEWSRIQIELIALGGQKFQFRDLRPRSATDHATGEHLGHKDPATLARVYRLKPKRVRPL